MPDVGTTGLPTTEDLVAEQHPREGQLLPAVENAHLGPLIEPYEHATPVSLDMLADAGEQAS